MKPQKYFTLDMGNAAESCIWRQHGEVAGGGIVAERCMVVDKHAAAEAGRIADDRERTDDGSLTDLCRRSHDGVRMHEGEKPRCAGCE